MDLLVLHVVIYNDECKFDSSDFLDCLEEWLRKC